MPGSGRDHAPASVRNCPYQFGSAGHHGHRVMIGRLATLQLPHFRLGVELRSNLANHFDRPDSVGNGRHFLFVDSPLARPDAPLPLHRTGGINKNSVEIEENGGTQEGGHSFFLPQGGGLARRRRQCWVLGSLAELQMTLAEVRSGALAPGAHEPVVQTCAKGGTDEWNHASRPLLHYLSTGPGGDALNHTRNEFIDDFLLDQLA